MMIDPSDVAEFKDLLARFVARMADPRFVKVAVQRSRQISVAQDALAIDAGGIRFSPLAVETKAYELTRGVNLVIAPEVIMAVALRRGTFRLVNATALIRMMSTGGGPRLSDGDTAYRFTEMTRSLRTLLDW